MELGTLKCLCSLVPLIETMKQDLWVVDHIFSHDTTMPTLREPTPENRGKQAKKNYMWVYTGPSKKNKKFPIVIYDFAEGRGSEYPVAFLKDFIGYLQADAYSSYEAAPKQNDVDPLAYLADVLARIPTHPNKRIHELLPYHWKPPLLRKEQIEKVA